MIKGVNRRRGEVRANIDGNDYCLCLTLGALAELENRLDIKNLSTLCERFSSGGFSAEDLIAILGAGLRGGGHLISDEEVAEMHMDGGLSGFVGLAAELLNATFSTPENTASTNDFNAGDNPPNPIEPQEAGQ